MKKVLIVEDQRMPRENMERILLDSGKYALSASVNGADVALAVCRQEKIDLILKMCIRDSPYTWRTWMLYLMVCMVWIQRCSSI